MFARTFVCVIVFAFPCLDIEANEPGFWIDCFAGDIDSIGFSATHKTVAVGDQFGELKVIDVGKKESIQTLDFSGRVLAISFHPTLNQWACISEESSQSQLTVGTVATDGTLTIDFKKDLTTHTDYAAEVRFSPDGRYVAAVTARIDDWDLAVFDVSEQSRCFQDVAIDAYVHFFRAQPFPRQIVFLTDHRLAYIHRNGFRHSEVAVIDLTSRESLSTCKSGLRFDSMFPMGCGKSFGVMARKTTGNMRWDFQCLRYAPQSKSGLELMWSRTFEQGNQSLQIQGELDCEGSVVLHMFAGGNGVQAKYARSDHRSATMFYQRDFTGQVGDFIPLMCLDRQRRKAAFYIPALKQIDVVQIASGEVFSEHAVDFAGNHNGRIQRGFVGPKQQTYVIANTNRPKYDASARDQSRGMIYYVELQPETTGGP